MCGIKSHKVSEYYSELKAIRGGVRDLQAYAYLWAFCKDISTAGLHHQILKAFGLRFKITFLMVFLEILYPKMLFLTIL